MSMLILFMELVSSQLLLPVELNFCSGSQNTAVSGRNQWQCLIATQSQKKNDMVLEDSAKSWILFIISFMYCWAMTERE